MALPAQPRVELELNSTQIEDDCLQTHQIQSFLEQIPKWKSTVRALTIGTDETFDAQCRKDLVTRLKTLGFQVKLVELKQPGLSIRGRLDAALVAALPRSEKSRADTSAEQKEPEKAEDPLPTTLSSPLASADKEKEAPRVPEEESDIRWSISISPGWLIASGSGIPTNGSGLSSGSLVAEYRLNTRSEVRMELLTPVRSESAMPLALILSGEFSYRLIGETPFSKELLPPPLTVSGIAGLLDFSQSPGVAQPLTAYQEGSTILSEVFAPYFGASVTRPLGRSTTVTAKALLIPVLPISSNTMTLSSRLGMNMDYYWGSLTIGVGASISSFTLAFKDPTPYSLSAVYRWVGFSVKYHF